MTFRLFRTGGLGMAVTTLTVLVAGCESMTPTQKGTAVGAGVGAIAGAVIGGNKTGAAVGGAVGALGGYVWSKNMADKKAAMERATAGTGVAVTQTPDNRLKLDIPSDISFDTGRSAIKPSLQPILAQFASGLNHQPNTEILIVGHTDSTGSDAINDPLSTDRAASARDFLAARGVSFQRVRIEGRGSHEPIADNTSEAGRARNRRIEIYLAERAVAQR